MSHFSVLVIGSDVEGQLAKYDENLELPMHLVKTKEQLIAKERERIEDYKNWLYARYLADPDKYIDDCKGNGGHIDYITKIFPEQLEWTDEQCYEHVISQYRQEIEEGAKWCEIHDDGSLWSTSNTDNAKWDWYIQGGRFRGKIKLKEPNQEAPLYTGWQYGEDEKYEQLKKQGYCDSALVKDIANLDEIVTFAIVKDGEWHEKGEMGWWAIVSNEKDKGQWEEEVKSLLKDLPEDTLVTVVDCHI